MASPDNIRDLQAVSGQILNDITNAFSQTTAFGAIGQASIKVDGPIGLPPTDNRNLGLGGNGPAMHNVTQDAMPLLEIMPCYQEFKFGLGIYTLRSGYSTPSPHTQKSYKDELGELGVVLQPDALSTDYIKFSYLNINPPVESFNNDFEDSIFKSNASNYGTQFTRQLAFATNTRSLGDASRALESGLYDPKNPASTRSKTASILKDARENFAKTNPGITSLVNTAQGFLTGRIDFPQFWRSSSWSPSYNVNIRLYNPYPNDKAATEKYITGPLASLMMFVVPRSTDGHTFHWPWLCKFRAKGLFDVQAGFVRSIQVVKGGDDNSIAMNQRVGIVDVKMELGALYTTMVNDGLNPATTDRPQLKSWLNQFSSAKTWADGSSSEGLTQINTIGPNGPNWVKDQENVSVSVANDENFEGITLLETDSAVLQGARKVFDSSAVDRGPDTLDLQPRNVQANQARADAFNETLRLANIDLPQN
jgi:hypothetical protein